MRPRKLTVLRINDHLREVKSNRSLPQTDMPPESIEIFTLDDLTGIRSWEVAVRFWSAYQNDSAPDLVVADVHFDHDESSPLSQALPRLQNHLPTGLSHLKPFAALARATGHLFGVGIHTAEAGLWERLLLSDSLPYRCMSFLAAHEIAEVAAILEEINLVEEVMETQSLTPLWRWLEKNARASFNGALRLALRNYRRRLHTLAAPPPNQVPGIFIMPDEYASVINWCDRMRRHPHPLDDDNDCGLILTYRDGKRDCIFLSSLFADVEGVTTRVLDAECFDLVLNESGIIDPIELDPLGLPRMGAFLARLGTLNEVYTTAVSAVLSFPYLPDEIFDVKVSLRALLPSEILARGLVVLLQHLRIEKTTYERWHERYSSYAWSPREGRFPSDLHEPQKSLKAALEKLISLIHGVGMFNHDPSQRAPFSIDEVVETIDEQGLEWVIDFKCEDAKSCLRWHFERLVDARILAHAPNNEYFLISPDRHISVLPIPRVFPHSRTVGEVLELPTQKEWLKLSLGFADNDNGVGQTLCDAFIQDGVRGGNERAKKGREFAEQYEEGKGPMWLLRICESYVENELQWRDRRIWPGWLHYDR